jgi:hypothetical protein
MHNWTRTILSMATGGPERRYHPGVQIPLISGLSFCFWRARKRLRSSIWTVILESGHRNSMTLELLIERTPRDAKPFGGALYAPLFLA